MDTQQKRFRFGNGLPQFAKGQAFALGVHSLDAPGVLPLLSVATLTIDFCEGEHLFSGLDPES